VVFEKEYSCDAHLLNDLLETDVPSDDAIVVSAGKMRKLWDFLSELPSSLCEGRLERTVLRPALLPVKSAQFTLFFRQVWRHIVIAQFNWECIGCFRSALQVDIDNGWRLDVMMEIVATARSFMGSSLTRFGYCVDLADSVFGYLILSKIYLFFLWWQWNNNVKFDHERTFLDNLEACIITLYGTMQNI